MKMMAAALPIRISTFDQLREVNSRHEVPSLVLISQGEICDHLLQVLKFTNIKEIQLSLGAVGYVFGPGADGRRAAGNVDAIINRHLQGDRDVLLCQDQLIDAGFKRWARL